MAICQILIQLFREVLIAKWLICQLDRNMVFFFFLLALHALLYAKSNPAYES